MRSSAARAAARSSWALALLATICCGACPPSRPPRQLPTASALPRPPRTAVVEQRERLHGVTIVDPYRWLEGDTPAVKRWVAAQNRHTRAVLDAIDGRRALRARLAQLLRQERIGTPVARTTTSGARRLFFTRRAASANQPVLYAADGLRGRNRRALVDPNRLSADGTAALDWWFPSRRGRYVAYGISRSGDEMSTLRVRDVERHRDLSERIPRTPHTSLAWTADGFYYVRLPRPGSVPRGQEHYHRHVYYHALGADPARDVRVFGAGRDMREMPALSISPSGRYLVITAMLGWDRSELYLIDRQRPGAGPVALVRGRAHRYLPEVLDDRIFVLTDEGAPRLRVFVVDPRRPQRPHWRPLIAQSPDVISSLHAVGGKLVLRYMHRATSRLRVFSYEGRPLGEVALPRLGTVKRISGAHDKPELFLSFRSYMLAPRVLWGSMARLLGGGKLAVWAAAKTPFDPRTVTLRQLGYRSADGTAGTMFVMHRPGLRRDGNSPTLLYGYGGFNIPVMPRYRPQFYDFIQRGGVYVEANLRGGGEHGESWHRAGMLGRKQNTFDDFIAAAEELIRRRFTRRGRLAIYGGSNGGLLVGAAAMQRPQLFRAVVCAVPLLDMLRYHRFLIARLWVPEYGSADDPEQFRWLHKYSPYHHVRRGVAYPAVLFTSGVADGRVHPFHARKMAARLQAASKGGPVLLRTESKAGHGAGKPVKKRIDELTDVLSFVMWQLGMTRRR